MKKHVVVGGPDREVLVDFLDSPGYQIRIELFKGRLWVEVIRADDGRVLLDKIVDGEPD